MNTAVREVCCVCGTPAVQKRIFCSDCQVWAHPSCASKKKCCDTPMASEINKKQADDDNDDRELSDSLIHESLIWENSILKDTTCDQKSSIEELCKIIKILMDRNSVLENELKSRKLEEEKKQQTLIQQCEYRLQVQISYINDKFDRIFQEINKTTNCLQSVKETRKTDKYSTNNSTKTLIRKTDNLSTHHASKYVASSKKCETNTRIKTNSSVTNNDKELCKKQPTTRNTRINKISENDINNEISNLKDVLNATHVEIKIPEENNSQRQHSSKSRNAEDDFQLVENKKNRKQRNKRRITFGEALIDNSDENSDVNNTFLGRTRIPKKEKKIWLFISQVQDHVSESIIASYIARKNKIELATITVKELEVKKKMANNKCFLVGLDPVLKETAYKPNFWPQGVGYSRFNFKLGSHFLGQKSQTQLPTS